MIQRRLEHSLNLLRSPVKLAVTIDLRAGSVAALHCFVPIAQFDSHTPSVSSLLQVEQARFLVATEDLGSNPRRERVSAPLLGSAYRRELAYRWGSEWC